MGEIVTKEIAAALVGGLDQQRKDVARAVSDWESARLRIEAAEARLARTLALIARALEGIPLENLKREGAATDDGHDNRAPGSK